MMDPLEWTITLGNVNVAIWLQQSLGWVYSFVKFSIYLFIIILIVRKVVNLYRYQYAVNIYYSGPEKTLTTKKDRGMIFKTKDTGRLVFRLMKRKMNLAQIPEKSDMVPMMGNKFFWQPTEQINLYCYGNSEYSFTPISASIKDEKVKWKAVEPALGPISQAIKETSNKMERPSFWSTPYGPLVISLIPFLIFGMLLFMNSAHFKEASATQQQSTQMLVEAMERMADSQCIGKTIILPEDKPNTSPPQNQAEEVKQSGDLVPGIPW